MNIVIFYEHLVREWDACMRLKSVFEKGQDQVKVYSLIFERTKAYAEARRNKPDIIFVPWFVDKEHEEFLSPLLDLNPDVRVVNLHQEQIGSKNSESQMCAYTPYTNNGSFHFAWGEHFRQLLMRSGVKPENIVVTGSVRNDFREHTVIMKEDLAGKFGLDPKKKWVLFAENRGWLLGRDSQHVRDIMRSRGYSDEKFNAGLERERRNLNAFVSQMQELDSSFADTYEFIYRPHPGTELRFEVPEFVHIIGSRSIYDWIACCDLYLTCESTSIFEAEMMGKPCAYVPSVIEPVDEDKMAGVWDYPRLERLSMINEQRIEEIKLQMNKKKIYERYLGIVDGRAAERVYEASKQILDVPIRAEDKVYSRATTKQLMRQFAYEKVTWIMVKLGLLDRIKYPRSAYVEKRDIPYSSENAWISEKQ